MKCPHALRKYLLHNMLIYILGSVECLLPLYFMLVSMEDEYFIAKNRIMSPCDKASVIMNG